MYLKYVTHLSNILGMNESELERLVLAQTSPGEFQQMYDEILRWTTKYFTNIPQLRISKFKYESIMSELDDVSKKISAAYSDLLIAQKNFSLAIGKNDLAYSKFVIGELRHKYKNFDLLHRKKESLEDFLRVRFIVPFNSTFLDLIKFEITHESYNTINILNDALEKFYPPDILVVGIIETEIFDILIENAKSEKIKNYIIVVRDLSDEKILIEDILIRICNLGDFELFGRIIQNIKYEVRLFWRLLRVTNSYKNSPEHNSITDYLWREISIHSI